MNMLHTDLKKLILKEEMQAKRDARWRLRFHVTPPTGWLNDPNALCQMDGVYHAFFQYAPFDAKGGLKAWGHCQSKDLLHWQYLGAPLLPDEPFDCHGAYSGSAFLENGVMHIFYTGNVKFYGAYDYITEGRGSATIHAKYDFSAKEIREKRCVLENKDYPGDLTCHVRDPKVFYEDGAYWMVLGARTRRDTGQVLLWKGTDLEHFSLARRLESAEPFGYMWECPDLFLLDGKRILSVSPQGVEKDGIRFWNVYASGYYTMKGQALEDCTPHTFREWDFGFDFYAPQTFLDEQGRRILIGWMGMPDADAFYTNPSVEDGWQHALTLPRELCLVDGAVCQQPVKELALCRGEKRRVTDPAEAPLCFDFELENPAGESFSVCFGGASFCFDREKGIFTLQFLDASGAGRDCRHAAVPACGKLRAVVDASSIEVFLNEGQTVFTTRFYPEKDSIQVVVEGDAVKAALWPLEFGKPEI